MKDKTKISEERTTAASFIIGFYEIVVLLKQNYANYLNVMEELQNRYGENIDKLEPEDRENLKQIIANTKFYIRQTYIDYTTIHNSTKDKKKENTIEKLYEEIKEDGYVINREKLEKFVLEANMKLAEDIIKDLLKSSADVLSDMYQD